MTDKRKPIPLAGLKPPDVHRILVRRAQLVLTDADKNFLRDVGIPPGDDALLLVEDCCDHCGTSVIRREAYLDPATDSLYCRDCIRGWTY
ncbi:MAG TPA: hypothetical protein VIH17_01970 [Candidatus Acidoferrales bacterium]